MRLIEVKEIKVYLQDLWFTLSDYEEYYLQGDCLPAAVFRKMKAASSSQTMVKFLPGHRASYPSQQYLNMSTKLR
jgi:hypothetical protein